MTNFKSGSGNLDFGGDDSTDSAAESDRDRSTAERSPDENTTPSDTDRDATDSAETSTASPAETYPYFVRRNNVGDERDTRLEIHVRDKVADREAQFRHELAERLDAGDVSKTDAREFALLAAFEHPDLVAELMRAEGFDTLG